MINATFTVIEERGGSPKRGSVTALIGALRRQHREMRRISELARRERLALGYARIPARVWDRRSALFMER